MARKFEQDATVSIAESWLQAIARVSEHGPSETLEEWHIGHVLSDGRYEIRGVLGRGGMGAVYEVWDHQLASVRALKSLSHDRPALRRRFKREFRSLQDLAHPNLVSLGELGEQDDRLFFTMERVRGVAFDVWCRPDGVLDVGRLQDAALQLAAALHALHSKGRAHRDIKPSNVLVERSGRVVLLDLGLTEEFDSKDPLVAGTLAYASPEQLAGGGVSAAADWYSLGTMLYEVVAGTLPFGADAQEIVEAKRTRRQPPHLGSNVPWSGLVHRLVDPDPEQRDFEPELAAPPSAHRSLWVGRDEECDWIRTWLHAEDSPPAAFLGVGGVGKSALARAARREATRLAIPTFSAVCRAQERIPFQALDGVIDALQDYGSSRFDAPPSEAEQTPFHRRSALRRQLRTAFETFAVRPLLVIDDAQWMDPDSADVLEALVREPSPVRVLFFGREAPPLDQPISKRDLRPLEERDAAMLAASFLQGHPTCDDGSLIDALVQRADGNAFILERLAENVRRGLTLDSKTDVMPELASLSDDEHAVLALVGVAGSAAAEVVAHCFAPRQGLGACVARLRAGGWLSGTLGRHGRLDLPHERVLQALGTSEDPEANRRLAVAYESVAPECHADLAHHWECADDNVRASEHAERAAEMALKAGAVLRAARLFETARRLAPESEERGRSLSRSCARAYVAAGRGAKAASHFLDASRGADASTKRTLELDAADALLRAGHIDEGLKIVDGVLALVGLQRPEGGLATVLAIIREKAALAASSVRRQDRADIEPEALRVCRAVALGLSQVDPGLSAVFQARYSRLAQQSNDPRHRALAMCQEVVPLAIAGPPARRAHRKLAAARTLASSLADPNVDVHVHLGEAGVAFLTGQFEEALHRADYALSRTQGGASSWERATAERYSLACLWHTGRLQELRRRTLRSMESAVERGDLYARTQLQTTVLPIVHLMDDRPEQALSALDEAVAAWSTRITSLQHWQHGQALALVHLYQGTPEVALAWMEKNRRPWRQAIIGRIQAVRIFSAAVRGLLCLALFAKHGSTAALADAQPPAKVLRKERGARAFSSLIDGQIATATSNLAHAKTRFATSAQAADEQGLELIASCAREGTASLCGGPPVLDPWLDARGVVRPDRFRRIMGPMIARVQGP